MEEQGVRLETFGSLGGHINGAQRDREGPRKGHLREDMIRTVREERKEPKRQRLGPMEISMRENRMDVRHFRKFPYVRHHAPSNSSPASSLARGPIRCVGQKKKQICA